MPRMLCVECVRKNSSSFWHCLAVAASNGRRCRYNIYHMASAVVLLGRQITKNKIITVSCNVDCTYVCSSFAFMDMNVCTNRLRSRLTFFFILIVVFALYLHLTIFHSPFLSILLARTQIQIPHKPTHVFDSNWTHIHSHTCRADFAIFVTSKLDKQIVNSKEEVPSRTSLSVTNLLVGSQTSKLPQIEF